MIQTQTVLILVNFLTVIPTKYIHPSATAAAVVAARKLSSQNLTEVGRKHAGPFLNRQIQILS